ncbi:hypothetical protein F5878DRAFT_84377 [Lentinula raphanica]|uniref:Uncharacterized protein n=1 Tax=Lentinula raphanica TaxID=153919 RepID=A0AA38PC11_9AGAR|nr:hypothetical protein F5878DRAFT_84377 [Lentinula raphanica]
MFSTTTATKQKANERDGAKEALRNFVSRSPNNHYTFDSERDAPQSEICRDDPNNHECITLQMNSRQMFAAMQVGSKRRALDALLPSGSLMNLTHTHLFSAVPWVLLFITNGSWKDLYGM